MCLLLITGKKQLLTVLYEYPMIFEILILKKNSKYHSLKFKSSAAEQMDIWKMSLEPENAEISDKSE